MDSLPRILEAARAAAGYPALRAHSGHVSLEGPSHRHGLEGRCRLTFSSRGELIERFEGSVSTVTAFDGTGGWGLDMTGMPMSLDLDDIETPRLVFAVLSGVWLDGEGVLAVALDPATTDARHVGLRLGFAGGAVDASLVLDAATMLPRRLSRPLVGWERTWEFAEYATERGLTLPRAMTHTQGGLTDVTRFETMSLISDAAPSPYRRVIEEPNDFSYQTGVSPQLALKKIPTGHVFVRPRIDGQDVGWFAFDTGSGAGFTILRSVADRLGMPRFGQFAGGGAGTAIHTSAFRQGRSFALGPVTIENSIYAELPEELNTTMKRLADIDVVGTCGYDLFRRSVVELDIARAEATLHPPDGGPAPSEWFELTLQHRIPGVRCRFEGGHEGILQIDTGAGPLVLFHSPAVSRLKLLEGRSVKPMPVQGAAGSVDAMVGKLGWIEIAGRRLTDVPALFVTGTSGALADPHTIGTAGGILLAGKKLVFDYGRRRLGVTD